MINKLPQLKIHDEESFNRYRLRYHDKTTKKEKYIQVSYGKTRSKEDALEKINEKRDKLILELTAELEQLREAKNEIGGVVTDHDPVD